MAAIRIVAQPGTLTGSIGVIAGKPALHGAWDRLGVAGPRSPAAPTPSSGRSTSPISEQGRARVDGSVGLALQASSRPGSPRAATCRPERRPELAKGRVWAGETALDLGLVDELGGMDEALAGAATPARPARRRAPRRRELARAREPGRGAAAPVRPTTDRARPNGRLSRRGDRCVHGKKPAADRALTSGAVADAGFWPSTPRRPSRRPRRRRPANLWSSE